MLNKASTKSRRPEMWPNPSYAIVETNFGLFTTYYFPCPLRSSFFSAFNAHPFAANLNAHTVGVGDANANAVRALLAKLFGHEAETSNSRTARFRQHADGATASTGSAYSATAAARFSWSAAAWLSSVPDATGNAAESSNVKARRRISV